MKKRNRKIQALNAAAVDKMYRLYKKDFSAKDAADIIGISDEAVRTYYKVFRRLESHEPIAVPKKSFCGTAVKEFCDTTDYGFVYRHEEDSQEEQLPGQVSIDEITEMNHGTNEEEPQNIRDLRERIGTVIGAFVVELVREYMKQVTT